MCGYILFNPRLVKSKSDTVKGGGGLDRLIKGGQAPAEEGAVLEHLVEVVHVPGDVEVLLGDEPNPFQRFLGELLRIFAVDLQKI